MLETTYRRESGQYPLGFGESNRLTFYKTLFARMNNVKAGKFVDDETGESLNDVEKVLSNLGIQLRDTNGLFRDSSAVLDEVGEKWSTFDNVQQHAIATAFAGTRQQEKFIVLMENYGAALEYANTAASSTGTALQKYEEAYMDSIEARMNALTAAWQEFSASLLDSDIVKFFVDVLNVIVNILNTLASIHDGALVTIPLITVALVALYAILLKIKATTTFTTMLTALKSVLAIFPAILAGLKAIYLRIVAKIAAVKASSTALYANAAANTAAAAAQEAFNATNPIGWIMLAITAIYALIKGISKLAAKEREASEAANAAYENAKTIAEESAEGVNELAALVIEYRDLVKDISDAFELDAEKRQKVLDIQNKINALTSAEIGNVDLLNGSIDGTIEKLTEVQVLQAQKAKQDAEAAYARSKDANNEAYVQDENHDGFQLWMPTHWFYDATFERGKDADKYADKAYDIIAAMDDRLSVAKDANIGDKFYGLDFNGKDAKENAEALTEVIDKLYAQGANAANSETYRLFVQWRDEFQNYVDNVNKEVEGIANSAVEYAGWSNYKLGSEIDSVDDYKDFKQTLLDAVSSDSTISSLLSDGDLSKDYVEKQVDNWLSKYFPTWYNKSIETLKKLTKISFTDVFDDIGKEFDTLSNALEEVTNGGIVAAEAITELLKTYPGLEKYFKLTSQGYVINDDYSGMSTSEILQLYATDYLQTYVDELAKYETGSENATIAQSNLNTAMAAMATLLRPQLIEDATSALEDQQDTLENSLDNYKDLIDVRKDLLKTYQEELDYQEELAKKQNSVADLQARIAVAKLDKSAAGRARLRELEAELQDGEEELEEFTLKHAIDEITGQLDIEYENYEKFIKTEVDRLETAINNIAKNLKITFDTSGEDVSVNVETHHTGGFAGNMASLRSNEVFAKLLRGELVSTPAQMEHFMNATLPSMLGYGGGGDVNYYAPLISLECGSVAQETLPELEALINKAIEKLKAQIDSGLSRNGFKRTVNKFST